MVFRLVSVWSSYQVDKEVRWMSLWVMVNPRTPLLKQGRPFLHFLLVIWLKVHYCSVIIAMGWCDSNDHYAYIGSDLLSLISLFSNGLIPWCCVRAPMVQSKSACLSPPQSTAADWAPARRSLYFIFWQNSHENVSTIESVSTPFLPVFRLSCFSSLIFWVEIAC